MIPLNRDHPIFIESIRRIRGLLGDTGLDPLSQDVLERLVHSSGDPSLAALLQFSPGACSARCRDPHGYSDGGCGGAADGGAHLWE